MRGNLRSALGNLEYLELFTPWTYIFRSEHKPKVGHFRVAEEAFGQDDPEVVFVQFFLAHV